MKDSKNYLSIRSVQCNMMVKNTKCIAISRKQESGRLILKTASQNLVSNHTKSKEFPMPAQNNSTKSLARVID